MAAGGFPSSWKLRPQLADAALSVATLAVPADRYAAACPAK